jgi:DNA polymerase-2
MAATALAAVERTGWLLDVFDDPHDGLVLWFLGEDGGRYRLHQPFQVRFYAAGDAARLRALEEHLHSQPVAVRLEHIQRRDMFVEQPVDALQVEVQQTAAQPSLFNDCANLFPDLTYYDADLLLALRYGAATGVFPLAYCAASWREDGRLLAIRALDSPWELDPPAAPLRILSMEPDANPSHTRPGSLHLRAGGRDYSLALTPERPFLHNLRAILESYDPDLLLTNWGDTWLLPYLLDLARRWEIPLPINREPGRGVARRGERTYFSYGQVIHRGQQVLLFGRWHIDQCNAMLWGDYGLEGVLELARVTGLPAQTAARVSPGTGISSMEILTALRQDILVPWHKQQAEGKRTALDLFYSDQGGLVYQPLLGLHRDVAEIDFISMYPSIMVHFNISPETIGSHSPSAENVPALGLSIDREHTGMVPQTLKPLLDKRIALKGRLAELPAWDPRRRRYKVYASAHKWLLVTCFGYLGYKNARFGRIEAHQAVTAYGREVLLLAKEAAEAQGCTVLHLYVDGLWVSRPGASRVADFQPLLDEIAARSGLPIALDGIYRWVAFLPSRRNERIPVANRYFGVFQDGSLKVRGIEARREDTPPFIVQTQMEMLEILAQAPDADALPDYLPMALARLRRSLNDLNTGRLALEDCLVTQKVSRTLEEFRTPSPAAVALAQLQAAGKSLRPGQRIRFLYLRGEPRVQAWDTPDLPPVAALDTARYRTLLLRAASTILQPLGMDETLLRDWMSDRAVALPLPWKQTRQPAAHASRDLTLVGA